MSATTLVEAVWLGLAACSVTLEVAGRVRPGFPGFADALAAFGRLPVGRPLALLAWSWLGWHLFVRAHF